jgi:hypothetical protein
MLVDGSEARAEERVGGGGASGDGEPRSGDGKPTALTDSVFRRRRRAGA